MRPCIRFLDNRDIFNKVYSREADEAIAEFIREE